MLRSVQDVKLAFSVVIVGLLTVSSVGDAAAKARSKPKIMETAAPSVAVSSPARFFTINQVLAKLDTKAPPESGARLAAVEPDGKRDDSAAVSQAIVARAAAAEEPFGLLSFRAPQGQLWTKWRAVSASTAIDAGEIAWCREGAEICSGATVRYLALLQKMQPLSAEGRVALINRAANDAVEYTSDYLQHGVADRWSSPLATLASGRGDCEDYALLKYALLKDSGFDPADLRIFLVRDMQVQQDHAVLAVRTGGRWLVLDNRIARPIDIADVKHFMPLFALDHDGVKLLAAPYAARPLHESEIDLVPAAADIVP